MLVQSLLKTPEEFAAVPLRTNADGSVVKVKDVGRTELGTEIPDLKFKFNGKPAGVFAVRQEAGANALETADRVKAKMMELSRFFPPGMKVIFIYDTTPFVKVAIDEVFKRFSRRSASSSSSCSSSSGTSGRRSSRRSRFRSSSSGRSASSASSATRSTC